MAPHVNNKIPQQSPKLFTRNPLVRFFEVDKTYMCRHLWHIPKMYAVRLYRTLARTPMGYDPLTLLSGHRNAALHESCQGLRTIMWTIWYFFRGAPATCSTHSNFHMKIPLKVRIIFTSRHKLTLTSNITDVILVAVSNFFTILVPGDSWFRSTAHVCTQLCAHSCRYHVTAHAQLKGRGVVS